MMVKRKKTVIAAICMAVASVGFVAETNASAPPKRRKRLLRLICKIFI